MSLEKWITTTFNFVTSCHLAQKEDVVTLFLSFTPILKYPDEYIEKLLKIYGSLTWYSPIFYADAFYITFQNLDRLTVTYIETIWINEYTNKMITLEQFISHIEVKVI